MHMSSVVYLLLEAHQLVSLIVFLLEGAHVLLRNSVEKENMFLSVIRMSTSSSSISGRQIMTFSIIFRYLCVQLIVSG